MRFHLRNQRIQVGAQLLQSIQRELVDAPANPKVQQFVFLWRQNHQVLRPVIKAIGVAMVNVLVAAQRAAEDLLHYQPMFRDALSVHGVESVATTDGALAVACYQASRDEQFVGIDSLRVHRAERQRDTVVPTPLMRSIQALRNRAVLWQGAIASALAVLPNVIKKLQLVERHSYATSLRAVTPTIVHPAAAALAVTRLLAARNGALVASHSNGILTYCVAVKLG
jgi:hypothetical protein